MASAPVFSGFRPRITLGLTALALVAMVACDPGGGGNPVAPTLSRVAAGSEHMLAIKPDGTVWAWGSNADGELGNGTTVDSSTPVAVNLPGSMTAVSAGGGILLLGGGFSPAMGTSLALGQDGNLWAWGNNQKGQLGDGTTTNRATPVAVKGLTSVMTMSAGVYHCLAVKQDGSLWAWGANDDGELGDGTTTPRPTPVQVPGLTGVMNVKALQIPNANEVSLAVKNDGTVWVWGWVAGGLQPGAADAMVTAPEQVKGISGVIAIDGEAGLGVATALKADGTVWTWGGGQAPAQVTGLVNAANIAGNLAVLVDGTIWTWSNGAPTQVPGVTNGLQVSGTPSSMLIRDASSHVWAMGGNTFGQLGDTTPLAHPSPQVSTLQPASRVSAHSTSTFALLPNGALWAWGSAAGNGDPFQVASLPGATAVANGGNHWLAVTGGTVSAEGNNYAGQLGNGTTLDSLASPVPVAGLAGVKTVATATTFSLALKTDGTVWSWGDNAGGALGDGTTTQRLAPVQALGLTGIQAIAVAGASPFQATVNHALALKADGTVWGWGYALWQMPQFTLTAAQATPTPISNLAGITALDTGPFHSLAVRNDGTVWAWGDNSFGELGDGTTTNRPAPVQVSGLANIITVACGGLYDPYHHYSGHSLALDATGQVWAWGANAYGQLGDGTLQTRLTPVRVPGLTGVTALVAGSTHSVALTPTAVLTWGSDYVGELGLGRNLYSTKPNKVF